MLRLHAASLTTPLGERPAYPSVIEPRLNRRTAEPPRHQSLRQSYPRRRRCQAQFCTGDWGAQRLPHPPLNRTRG